MGVVQDREPPDGISKHFTVAVFVVHEDRVLLHPHPKVGLWLPPGGHIEPHELPDDAAYRETLEETGLDVRLVGDRGITHDSPGSPRQLLRPEGVQVEDISDDPPHQHIDLIYFAVPGPGWEPDTDGRPAVDTREGMVWLDLAGMADRPVTAEVLAWVGRALREVPRRAAEHRSALG
ncbi:MULTISPECIES: NUDIX hydrolase [unclassified Serinicoccus]|uniref:NUDIX hydrolase n=1 Tax=unclassified Serinicoccus TaxID=2643101 RepID=UPI0038537587